MTEVRKFDAEVGKILHLMIHSLYTNKDIFLRELISNASDACDKLKFLSITNPGLMNDDHDLKITIKVDKENRLLTITDNGIGMNKDDMISNLGTIARSGTQKFLESLTGDNKSDIQLIGQFGVGFYSSFMVAEEVTVISCKAGEEQNYCWKSRGDGEFTVEEVADSIKRGTQITLKLREGEDDYLDKFRIRHIISTYSDHISVKIYFDEEGKQDLLNSSSALWMRPKSEITEEQYKEFYKNVAYAGDDPWITLHNKNEGTIEYTNLLFIPSAKPFDLFHPDRMTRVKLYVKRVFINDEGIDLVPRFLRFVKGIIDSEDLPLNISRENLQANNILEKIKRSVVKRILSELKKKLESDRDSYEQFWNNFGQVLKEGLCEGFEFRDEILDICLFKSALKDKYITLNEYTAEMKDGQNSIFYLSGDNIEKLKNSPQIEGLISKNIDVILLTDHVDDFWVNVIHEYKEKAIVSATRADINPEKLSENNPESAEEKKPEEDKNFDGLLSHMREVLKDKVKDVKLSSKLTNSPVCLGIAEGAMGMRMERFLLEQKQIISSSLKILEINPKHKIIHKLKQEVEAGEKDKATDLVHILYDEACIIEGEPIENPAAFASRVNRILEIV